MSELTTELGAHEGAVDGVLSRIRAGRILERVRALDHTLWKPDPAEIANRLGWLTVAGRMRGELPAIARVVDEVRADGYTHALLLGMGGSSLTPELFRKVFGVAPGYLDLAVLDSTDPAAVLEHRSRLDPARTLFIVSTKSGGTVETFSFFRYFYRWVTETLGRSAAGAHFIAITDPGSALADSAARYDFRATFLADPNIGGRYSALSHFGLVPASLLGVDVLRLLDRADAAAREDTSLARLGAIVGELAAQKRDKITFVLSPAIAAFGGWVEQLIAESTGKEGKGILPVADEPLGPPGVYGSDRLFMHIMLAGDATHGEALRTLAAAGQPLVRITLADEYELGGELFRWEMATAIAGWCLGINPFDQPDVESAKVLARRMVKTYESEGALPVLQPTLRQDGITAYAQRPAPGGGLEQLLADFLRGTRPGDYVALQAYVQPADYTGAAIQRLRVALRDRLRVATTAGYGPRFLHSTGQLHKGDAGNGVFIQLVTPNGPDVPIPDAPDAPESSISFGVLKQAQALGDRQALLDAGRRVIRFDLEDAASGIRRLEGALG